MKDPHDISEYEQTDEPKAPTAANDDAPTAEQKPEKRKKSKFSGAYYYVDVDEKKLSEAAFTRTVLTIIALMLQIVVLCLPQGSLEYITNNISSYAYAYVMTVLVFIGISIWLIIMNMTRYKFRKRIPVEYAPKNGFTRRAFFGNELYIAANALITALEISFVCISYDYVTLISVFLTALAVAASVGARQITHLALRYSELIPAAE